MKCPNKNSEAWKSLVEAIGEEKAMDAYTLNGLDIPTVRQAKRILNALNPVDNDKIANRLLSQKDVPDTIQQSNRSIISKERIDNGLSNKINNFLSSVGVSLRGVNRITDNNGTPITALAKAVMVQKTILFTNGRLDINQLGEEAAHFYVELLYEASPLFQEMYNNIDKYEIYKQVLNNYGDQYESMYAEDAGKRLRKEAMAQLINNHIIGNKSFESGPKQAFAIKWWDKVVNFIKSLFSKADVNLYTNAITSDPFYKSAQNLLTSNTEDLDLQKNLTGEYYQMSPKQKEIVDRIRSLDSQITLNEEDHTYSFNGKRIKESVTQIVDRLNPFRGQIDPNEKAAYQDAGRQIHGYLENAIKVAIAQQSGTSTQPIANNAIYNKILKYITDFVSRPEFIGGQFLTEVKVVDEKRNVAGTIDLAIVMPDGKVHIYDWKSVNFKTFKGEVLDERVSPTKERNYNIQLGEYKKILTTQYGVGEFGHVRVVPLQTIFKSELQNGTLNKRLKDIEIGGDERFLQPIISEGERTGVPALDNLLGALITRRHALENSLQTVRGSTDLERERKREFIRGKLVEIAHAITEIHTEHKIGHFLDYLSSEMDRLARAGQGSTEGTLDAYTDNQFEETMKNIDYFQDLLEKNLSPISDTIQGETKERLRQLATRFVEAKSLLYNDMLRRLQTIGDEQGISDITQADKQTGWWSRTMRYASQQFNKKIAALWKLVDKQKQKVISDHNKINNEIENKVRALKDWGAKNGLAGVKVYSKLINEDGTRLAAKFSQSFRDKVTKAYERRSPEDIAFLKDSTVFDRQAYERDLDGKIELWKEKYNNEEAVNKQISWYEDKYNVEKSDNAYGQNNRFLSWADKPENHSDEYKYIYQKGNEPLKDFYEYFIGKTQEWRDVMGLKKDRNFIWNVKKDFVERITQNGISAFKNMPSVLTQLENAEMERTQEVLTDESGQQIQYLPKYFIAPITKPVKQEDGTIKMIVDKEAKSQDLGKVLSLAGAMSLNYKYMAEIEDSAKVIRLAIGNSQEIVTDYRGRPVQDLIKGGVKTASTSAGTIEQFNDAMNYYLYGVKNKTKDVTFNFLGRKVSLLKNYSDISKYFVGKTLAANPMSILANVIGGDINARILGSANRYFSNSQYNRAFYKLLPSRDPKAYSILGYFDLMSANRPYEKANKLSASNLTKNLTWDKLFYGHEKTDFWIRNSILLAMMQNHTINENGEVVKKNETEKSLYDLTEVVEGQFSIPGLSENEYHKFRNRVQIIGERVLGNTTRDNLRGSQLTMLGRSMMMFRSWIPRMLDERFGELRQDYDLGEYEYGRYRAFAKTVFQDRPENIASNLLNVFKDFGVLGFKGWNSSDSNAAINARLQELYYKAQQENPSNITFEEFKQLYSENIKSSMMEFQLMIALGTLLLALKGTAGDDKDSGQKFTLAVASRALSEMAFFTGLGFNDILKNAVPIQSLVQQLSGLGKSTFIDIFGDKQPKQYKNSVERLRGMFPILYSFDRLEQMFEKGQ